MREREIHECNNHYYLLDNIQIYFDRSDNFKKKKLVHQPHHDEVLVMIYIKWM